MIKNRRTTQNKTQKNHGNSKESRLSLEKLMKQNDAILGLVLVYAK